MITAVDTNVLLDILIPNFRHCQSSKELLDAALRRGSLIICEMVYAELAAQFGERLQLDGFLQETGIKIYPSTAETLNLAGLRWAEHSKRRPKNMVCPDCGRNLQFSCPYCTRLQAPRQHILADFLIGAHALLQADRLLTRDRGYYNAYFPELELVS